MYAAVVTGGIYGHIDVASYGTYADWAFPALLVVISVLFGLWPDIDTNSKGQDIFFSGDFIRLPPDLFLDNAEHSMIFKI